MDLPQHAAPTLADLTYDVRLVLVPPRIEPLILVPGLDPPALGSDVTQFLAKLEQDWTSEGLLDPKLPGFGFAMTPIVPFGQLMSVLNPYDPRSFIGFGGVFLDGQFVHHSDLAKYPAFVLRKFYYLLRAWSVADQLRVSRPTSTWEARNRREFASISVPLADCDKVRPDGTVPWLPFPVGGGVYITNGVEEMLIGASRWPQHIDPVLPAAAGHFIVTKLTV